MFFLDPPGVSTVGEAPSVVRLGCCLGLRAIFLSFVSLEGLLANDCSNGLGSNSKPDLVVFPKSLGGLTEFMRLRLGQSFSLWCTGVYDVGRAAQ